MIVFGLVATGPQPGAPTHGMRNAGLVQGTSAGTFGEVNHDCEIIYMHIINRAFPFSVFKHTNDQMMARHACIFLKNTQLTWSPAATHLWVTTHSLKTTGLV